MKIPSFEDLYEKIVSERWRCLVGRNNHSYTDEQLIDYSDVKKNICQNMRIARKLANIKVKDAAPALGIEPESLKRIESGSKTGPSLEVLSGAIELYEKDPNFYWKNWKENEKLLDTEKEEN